MTDSNDNMADTIICAGHAAASAVAVPRNEHLFVNRGPVPAASAEAAPTLKLHKIEVEATATVKSDDVASASVSR